MRTFNNGVWTSELANKRANKERNGARVLAYLQALGEQGATDDDMQLGLPMDGNSQRPARRQLELDGLILRTTRTRPTTKGNPALVWTARKPT